VTGISAPPPHHEIEGIIARVRRSVCMWLDSLEQLLAMLAMGCAGKPRLSRVSPRELQRSRQILIKNAHGFPLNSDLLVFVEVSGLV